MGQAREENYLEDSEGVSVRGRETEEGYWGETGMRGRFRSSRRGEREAKRGNTRGKEGLNGLVKGSD